MRSGKVKEELVQHIQNLLVSQIKAQTEPPPPPPPPAPVEDEEKENNQILGHINNNVSILHCIIYKYKQFMGVGEVLHVLCGCEHAPVGERCHVLKCHRTMGRILCRVCSCVCVYFTMIEEINVHVCVYMMYV